MSAVDVVELTRELVALDSVNPSLTPGSGEAAVMQRVAAVLEDIGITPELQHVDEGRANVIGVLPGSSPEVLVLEAHLDTVPMPLVPCPPRIEDGRIWGRGACDTKASIAAMLVAVQALSRSDRPRPTVVFAGVVDEEYVMRGAEVLAAAMPNVDGIVIGEPTSLRPVRAHNGCVRFDIAVRGETAHSSKAHLGTNAIVAAARLVVALEDELSTKLAARAHVLTGSGLLSATQITGGTAPNVVPDLCTVRFDRRLTPGETLEQALQEVDGIVEALRTEHGVDATRESPWLRLPAVEMPDGHPLVGVAERACAEVLGQQSPASGVPYCTDANILTGHGSIPAVVVGPGSIDQAHAPVEWVEVGEVRQAVDVYLSIVYGACGALSLSRSER